jgi:hypothetical protein
MFSHWKSSPVKASLFRGFYQTKVFELQDVQKITATKK